MIKRIMVHSSLFIYFFDQNAPSDEISKSLDAKKEESTSLQTSTRDLKSQMLYKNLSCERGFTLFI